MEIKKRHTWSNSIKRESVTPMWYAIPENINDIVQLVKRAEADKLKIRAVGSGHSFNDIAITQDIMISTEKLKKVNTVDHSRLNSKWKDYLNNTNGDNPRKNSFIEVECGIPLHELNPILDKEFNMALLNMGGIDHQTISGVISTGTHGSGKQLPAFPGMVRSIKLVSAEGKVYRIEPEDGITNKATFNETDVKLIQDDKIFYSVSLSFGTMGVMYSFIIDVRPIYWMEEIKLLSTWSKVKEQLTDGSIFDKCPKDLQEKGFLDKDREVRAVMVQINPYKTKNNDHTVIVVYHLEIDERRLNWFERTRNPLSTVLSTRMFSAISYRFTLGMVNRRSHKTPNAIDMALKSLKDKCYINRSYKVLYQGLVYMKERAYDCEFAFDLSKDGYIKAVEDIFKHAEKMKDYSIYQTSPLGLRFVAAAKDYMSPGYLKETCYIDTPFLVETKAPDTMLEDYQEIMLAHGGAPHWGKINNILDGKCDMIPTIFPGFTTWKTIMKQFNPNGTFNNKYTTRLGVD